MSPKDAASVRIVVDVHETKSGIAEMLVELGASVERASLPAGDYAVGAETLIERKRVLDLHGAVLKGRLWPQLGKLRAACAFPYLLLEGTDVDRGPLHPNAVRGTCLAVIDQGIATRASARRKRSTSSSTSLSGDGRPPVHPISSVGAATTAGFAQRQVPSTPPAGACGPTPAKRQRQAIRWPPIRKTANSLSAVTFAGLPPRLAGEDLSGTQSDAPHIGQRPGNERVQMPYPQLLQRLVGGSGSARNLAAGPRLSNVAIDLSVLDQGLFQTLCDALPPFRPAAFG